MTIWKWQYVKQGIWNIVPDCFVGDMMNTPGSRADPTCWSIAVEAENSTSYLILTNDDDKMEILKINAVFKIPDCFEQDGSAKYDHYVRYSELYLVPGWFPQPIAWQTDVRLKKTIQYQVKQVANVTIKKCAMNWYKHDQWCKQALTDRTFQTCLCCFILDWSFCVEVWGSSCMRLCFSSPSSIILIDRTST